LPGFIKKPVPKGHQKRGGVAGQRREMQKGSLDSFFVTPVCPGEQRFLMESPEREKETFVYVE